MSIHRRGSVERKGECSSAICGPCEHCSEIARGCKIGIEGKVQSPIVGSSCVVYHDPFLIRKKRSLDEGGTGVGSTIVSVLGHKSYSIPNRTISEGSVGAHVEDETGVVEVALPVEGQNRIRGRVGSM